MHQTKHVSAGSTPVFEYGIEEVQVRGAPAIGAAGGFAIALEALRLQQEHGKVEYSTLLEAKEYIDRQVALQILRGCSDMDRHSARPTAVNLSWATGVVLSRGLRDGEVDVKEIVQAAKMIFEEDIKTNRM